LVKAYIIFLFLIIRLSCCEPTICIQNNICETNAISNTILSFTEDIESNDSAESLEGAGNTLIDDVIGAFYQAVISALQELLINSALIFSAVSVGSLITLIILKGGATVLED
jgi:hypothetical protein